MRKSLEAHTEDLEKTLSSRVSKEDFTSAQDSADKEKQLRIGLEDRVKELKYSLKELEISSQSANERLQNEQGLRQSLENNVKDLQVKHFYNFFSNLHWYIWNIFVVFCF